MSRPHTLKLIIDQGSRATIRHSLEMRAKSSQIPFGFSKKKGRGTAQPCQPRAPEVSRASSQASSIAGRSGTGSARQGPSSRAPGGLRRHLQKHFPPIILQNAGEFFRILHIRFLIKFQQTVSRVVPLSSCFQN